MVLGSRLAAPGAWREGGMPLCRYIANRGLTEIENRVLHAEFTELHTGHRATRHFSDASRPCTAKTLAAAVRFMLHRSHLLRSRKFMP